VCDGDEPSRPPERYGAHRWKTLAGDIFAEFEDVDPRSVLGSGDVKYHVGATGEFHSPSGEGELIVHLVSNPSHLEAVDPVAALAVRARKAGAPSRCQAR
jgi:2-oxoglutarate dehydrogenase complex dehydrogenase (E1) component-like enzyme